VKAAVVIVAYNRPAALRRLLDSLIRAWHADGTPLVISIDRGESGIDPGVGAIAETFEWPHGDKRVLGRERHLGVVGHFRACGELAAEYGAAVILEDDLTVAAPYYGFAVQALAGYEADDRIAGLCLYALDFNGFTGDPFLPVDDGADVFFMRLPYTQGIAFTSAQWQRLDAWRAVNSVAQHQELHPSFLRFGPDEWFPELAAYLVATGRYFSFPRVSLTTGWGDAGAHFAKPSNWFQTRLQTARRDYRLPALGDATAVYDGFFEIEPSRLVKLGASLPVEAFDLDLNATKQPRHLKQPHVLTTRRARSPLASFGLRLYPPELNVAYATPGADITLARREDVDWGQAAQLDARARLDAYFWARRRPSRRRELTFRLARLVDSLRGHR
jgi:hypothetical protein